MLQKGITLIETILALAFITLITGFVVISFGKVNANEALDKSADLVVSVLNEARFMTLSSVNDARYGVHFDSNQVVLFQGPTYNPSASSNVPTLLNAQVGIQNVSLSGGGSEVVFNRLTGETSQTGSLQIYLKSASTTYKTVNISSVGISERN
jgi:Tfp pilus assembly protein FimT